MSKESQVKQVIRTINHEEVGKEGKSPKGDSWLHPEINDVEHEAKMDRYFSRLRKSLKKSRRTEKLLKSLGGNRGKLNTSKLVRKRVMVRGKDGKVFYRMQWVDPSTGKPADPHAKAEDNSNPKPKAYKDSDEQLHVKHTEYKPVSANDVELEATRKVTKNPQNRKEFVDSHVTYNMTREQKYEMLDKHGVEWKRNEHESIDHKNAMVSLKSFLFNNIHLIGGEHMPTETPEAEAGKMDWDKFWKQWMKHPDLYGKLMSENGIAQQDPRIADKALGAIAHMGNVKKLKAHLLSKPDLLEKYYDHLPDSNEKKAQQKRDSKPSLSVSEKGNNNVEDILSQMSRQRVYELMKQYGIADSDPADNPAYAAKDKGGDGTAAIRHMRFKMALKAAIPKDSSKLNENVEGGLTEDAIKHIAESHTKATDDDKFNTTFNDIPTEIKKQMVEDFEDHEIMDSVKHSDVEAINHMRKLSALKAHMRENPELLEEYEEDIQNHNLYNMKLGVKTLARFLRAHDYKKIGDVVRSPDVEKGYEYRGGDGTVEIIKTDDGKIVLSVIDMGEFGDEWDEVEYPMEDVKRWVDELNESATLAKQVASEKPPLETQGMQAIFNALDQDFDTNYTPAVGEVTKDYLSKLFNNNSSLFDLATVGKLKQSSGNVLLTDDTLQSLFNKFGTSFGRDGKIAMTNAWKKEIYKDYIHDTKKHDAQWYIDHAMAPNDTFILHESAKQWTPEERTEARKELIKSAIQLHDSPNLPDHEQRMATLTDLTHKSLAGIPFDLFTDVMASANTADRPPLTFQHRGFTDEYDLGASYNPKRVTITLPDSYYTQVESGHTDPGFRPGTQDVVFSDGGTGSCEFLHLDRAVAHEFGHAIDSYLTGGNGVLSWTSKFGAKYIGGTEVSATDPLQSFKSKVAESGYEMGTMELANGASFTYYKDNWTDPYEGRVYDKAMQNLDNNPLFKKKDGKIFSITKGAELGQQHNYNGSEHASIAFETHLNLHRRHQEHLEASGDKGMKDIKDYAKAMKKLANVPEHKETARIASRYLHMSSQSPKMFNAVSTLLHGKDFRE